MSRHQKPWQIFNHVLEIENTIYIVTNITYNFLYRFCHESFVWKRLFWADNLHRSTLAHWQIVINSKFNVMINAAVGCCEPLVYFQNRFRKSIFRLIIYDGGDFYKQSINDGPWIWMNSFGSVKNNKWLKLQTRY